MKLLQQKVISTTRINLNDSVSLGVTFSFWGFDSCSTHIQGFANQAKNVLKIEDPLME